MLTLRITHPLNRTQQALTWAVEQHIIGVFGASGAGKSTLLKGIAGLAKGYVDNVSYAQQVLPTDANSYTPLYYLRQRSVLFPHLSVVQNLKLVITHGKRAKQCQFSLEEVVSWCELEPILQHKPGQLSGGQQQRAAFAQALLSGKPLLLLDEPFSALDWSARKHFCCLLRYLHQRYQLQFILVSHSLQELALSTDYLIHIHDFSLQQQGTTQALLPQLSAHTASVQSALVRGKVIAVLKDYNLTKVQLLAPSTQYIYINTPGFVDDEVQLPLVANKVSIAKVQPQQSSIVNCLRGHILSLKRKDDCFCVEVDVDEQIIFANISFLSLKRLDLKVQDSVYLQFKAN